MPRSHRRCTVCSWQGLLEYTLADVESGVWPPPCLDFSCDGLLEASPQPGDFAMDAKEPGQQSVIHRLLPTRDGLVQQREVIGSLHQMRQIERDSEVRYANGEGEPLRFRALSQSASNMDENSFGHSGTIGGRTYGDGQAPVKKQNIGVTRHGQTKPDVKLGPGMRRAASALKG